MASTLAEACRQGSSTTYPHASSISKSIPIYTAATVQSTPRSTILPELFACLHSGAGVFVVKGMYTDMSLLDSCDRSFQTIIERERTKSRKGDHFAPVGQYDRVWNSFQKLAMESSDDFVEYFANPVLSLICQAWLGKGYQMTSQLNITKPGGKAQEAHRDYHLGFADPTIIPSYPLPSQIATQTLTLQGAIAHSPMPIPSGPTLLLPFSQLFPTGYSQYRSLSNLAYFKQHAVQLPLNRGDGLFFNPALHHAAGDNTTPNHRSAHLLQVSSPFGRAMEVVDRDSIVRRCWPVFRGMFGREGMSERVEAAIASIAEGYAFPTNLDKDPPPQGSHTPPTQQDVLRQALLEGWETREFMARLDEWREKRVA